MIAQPVRLLTGMDCRDLPGRDEPILGLVSYKEEES
jgi:hypothetical protein